MKGQEDVVISIPKSEDSEDSFENLSITRRRIAQIQADIFNIIDRLQDNQSMITRAANYWGEQPGWKKISTGIFMVTSLLSLGIIAHVSLLITLSVVTAVGYFGGGAVLDDHYQSGQRSKINLKEGITSLTNMLGTIMEALDEACTQLNLEKFQENNKRYEDLLVVQERDRLLFKTTLAELSSRYNQLLREQGKQVDRLEKVADSHEAIFPRPLLYTTPSKFSRSKSWSFFDAHAVNDYLDFADTSDESLVSCARV